MNKVILIRFNEIHLKGGNKKYFTKLLYNNIKKFSIYIIVFNL